MARFPHFAVFAIFICPCWALAGDKDSVRIGIPDSVFRDVPPALLSFAGQPFKTLMKAQTGLQGDVVHESDAGKIAKALEAGKLQLGVFLGHEFAWVKNRYPDFEPIVCTVPRPKEIQAFILVRWDCKAKDLGDMKGMKLTLASTSRDHAKLFLEKRKAEEMAGGSFCSIEKASTVHDAIQKVMDGEADVTVTDSAAWSYFQKLYPGPSQNLRVLSSSDRFPPAVIAFKKGTLDDATIKSIRDGLMTAHQSSKGTRMMNTIKLEKFDAIPPGFADTLNTCLKAYPTPICEK